MVFNQNELESDMKSETFEGTVEAYQGKTLDKPIEFRGSVDLYENVGELKNSEDYPSDNEILKMVNQKKLTAAKASEYQNATKELKKAYEASNEFKSAQLVKAAMAAGFSQAEAEALAASKLS